LATLRASGCRLKRRGVPVVETRGERLALVDDVEVDFHQLTVAAHQCLDGVAPADTAPLEQLTNSSDLLGDWYGDWVLLEREHFRQLRLQALERLAIELARIGQYG